MWLSENPSHPGEILKFYLEDLELTQSALAEKIGCKIPKVNEICMGKRGISAEMALQLSDALGTTPLLWMNAQQAWDIAQALKKLGKKASDYLDEKVG
ncbi:MAG: HigA family addiction module antitoxin [Bdellovibrionota bacterium]